MKTNYLDFYNINFGTAKYCTKSWGLASYEAGAQSRQAEIDELRKKDEDWAKLVAYDTKVQSDMLDTIDVLQKRIDDLKYWCVRGVECNMLSTEYNQALIDMINILKGNNND